MTDFERLIAHAYHRYGHSLFPKRFHLLRHLFLVSKTGITYCRYTGQFQYSVAGCHFDPHLNPEQVEIDPIWNELNLIPVPAFLEHKHKNRPELRVVFDLYAADSYQGNFEGYLRETYIEDWLKHLTLVLLPGTQGHTNLLLIECSRVPPEPSILQGVRDLHRYIQQAHQQQNLLDPDDAGPILKLIEKSLTPWGGL